MTQMTHVGQHRQCVYLQVESDDFDFNFVSNAYLCNILDSGCSLELQQYLWNAWMVLQQECHPPPPTPTHPHFTWAH